jgi:cytochrome d ubiquinol oxidase subunit II
MTEPSVIGALELVLGASLVGALTFYLLTGGADFGAGMWSVCAFGRDGQQQRALIDQAIGPIWEANHVWLIIAVTILFTAFPSAFSLITTALHIPLSLMLIGIVLRGTAFAVRTHDISARLDGSSSTPGIWRYLFAGSSVITPALLGICLGAIASGRLPSAASGGSFRERFVDPWLAPFPLSVGLLTTVLVAYLASVYLLVEARDQNLRGKFRARAILSCCGVLLSSGLVFWLARDGAPQIYAGLRRTPVGMFAVLTAICSHGMSLVALRRDSARAARWCAVGGAVVMLWGWALSQFPFLVEPHLSIAQASPQPTLQLLLVSLAAGSAVLFPLLYWLYRIFKERSLFGRDSTSSS